MLNYYTYGLSFLCFISTFLSFRFISFLFYSTLRHTKDEYVYDECKNINGVPKLLLLKISVGLIVVQGLIEQFLVMADDSPYDDDSQFTTANKTQRAYCALVLIEFVLLSAVSYFAFGSKITASMNKRGGETAPEGLNSAVTQGAFFCSVMRFTDVFGTLTYNGSEGVDAPIMQQA